MAKLNINLSDPFMKALKAINSITGDSSSLKAEDLKKQRSALERQAKLATPPMGFKTDTFKVGRIDCEHIKPDFPHDPNTIILYCHGGGYTCGGLHYARILAAKLALATGLEVVSFEYRLAPENPYPAAFDDGMTMWDYLMRKGYGAKNVLIAGDSAGGNLALVLTQKIIKEDRIAPKALILFSPWTDMTATADSYKEQKDTDPILTYEYIVAVRNAYIGKKEPSDPRFSPLFGSFKDFPPTLIQVGKNELLLDDSAILAKSMKAAGVKVTYEMYKDGWHVFQQMPIPLANKAMEAVGSYVSELLYTR